MYEPSSHRSPKSSLLWKKRQQEQRPEGTRRKASLCLSVSVSVVSAFSACNTASRCTREYKRARCASASAGGRWCVVCALSSQACSQGPCCTVTCNMPLSLASLVMFCVLLVASLCSLINVLRLILIEPEPNYNPELGEPEPNYKSDQFFKSPASCRTS